MSDQAKRSRKGFLITGLVLAPIIVLGFYQWTRDQAREAQMDVLRDEMIADTVKAAQNREELKKYERAVTPSADTLIIIHKPAQ